MLSNFLTKNLQIHQTNRTIYFFIKILFFLKFVLKRKFKFLPLIFLFVYLTHTHIFSLLKNECSVHSVDRKKKILAWVIFLFLRLFLFVLYIFFRLALGGEFSLLNFFAFLFPMCCVWLGVKIMEGRKRKVVEYIELII